MNTSLMMSNFSSLFLDVHELIPQTLISLISVSHIINLVFMLSNLLLILILAFFFPNKNPVIEMMRIVMTGRKTVTWWDMLPAELQFARDTIPLCQPVLRRACFSYFIDDSDAAWELVKRVALMNTTLRVKDVNAMFKIFWLILSSRPETTFYIISLRSPPFRWSPFNHKYIQVLL